MKSMIVAFTSILIILVYGVYLNLYSVKIIPDTLITEPPRGLNDYKGVINVHSNKSLGSGSVEEIIEAAKANDLDFLIFNELNDFEAHSPSKYFQDLLVSFDGEYSYRNSRLLNLFSKQGIGYSNSGEVQMLLPNKLQSELGEDSELFVLAHPTKPGFKWKDEFPPGLLGGEVLNLTSIWERAWNKKKVSFFPNLIDNLSKTDRIVS